MSRLVGAQMLSYEGVELIQFSPLAMRSEATRTTVAAQLSVHPSQGERLIKSFVADLREVSEVH